MTRSTPDPASAGVGKEEGGGSIHWMPAASYTRILASLPPVEELEGGPTGTFIVVSNIRRCSNSNPKHILRAHGLAAIICSVDNDRE